MEGAEGSNSPGTSTSSKHKATPSSLSSKQSPGSTSTNGPISSSRISSSAATAVPGVPDGVRAQRVVSVTEAVMKKLTGLDSVPGDQAVAELVLPPHADFTAPGESQQVDCDSFCATAIALHMDVHNWNQCMHVLPSHEWHAHTIPRVPLCYWWTALHVRVHVCMVYQL